MQNTIQQILDELKGIKSEQERFSAFIHSPIHSIHLMEWIVFLFTFHLWIRLTIQLNCI